MTIATKKFRIVAVVCHPDDEAIWIGGLLHELSKFSFLSCHVVCVSGNDPASPRVAEFEQARRAAGYASGIVLGGPLRPALEALPELGKVLEGGLSRLQLAAGDIDLVLTHPPYGDEQANPHHVQAYREIKAWCAARDVPFGYFSCFPIPYFRHVPLMDRLRRQGTLHLLQYSRCSPALGRLRRHDPAFRHYDCPRYYLQFLADTVAKTRMLQAYSSIGLESHASNYAMFTNGAEAVYLADERSFAPFRAVLDAMAVPSLARPFRMASFGRRLAGKLRRLAGRD